MSGDTSRPTSPSPRSTQDQVAVKFQRAVEHHQRGQLGQAEALYHEILAHSPRHFDALHLAGIARLQQSDPEGAVESIRRAVDRGAGNPHLAAAPSNLGTS